ncbi:MAG: MFS transporter [Candidatus Aminicenantes bacterium]|nr:MFS transporter [Candidatus Aminicenantes bacterium]
MNERRAGGRSLFLVILVFIVFFVISLLTNIVGPLVPDIIRSFRLNLTLVALLPFAFFIAYGVMSIPSGLLLERVREKPVMLGAFGLGLAGALLFCLFPRYPTAVISVFLIGLGMAALQVTINPLLRTAGGEEHFAFNSVLAQFVFGGASFLSPHLYTYFVRNFSLHPGERPLPVRLAALVVPPELPWLSVYWVFAALVLIMILALAATRFPVVIKKEEERAGAWAAHRELFGRRIVVLYFLGIFAYVGTEQGVANWISQFLATYHGYDPQTTGAAAVSGFWGMMTVGCLLGLVLLKLFDSRRVLVGFAAAALVVLGVALFGPGPLARWAFPLLGFTASVMWSIIFSLALNSVDRHHGSFSGILCTGIIGGALVPLAIGWLGDRFGLRFGLCLLFLTLAYVLSIGLWARPLIVNATISARRTEGRREA